MPMKEIDDLAKNIQEMIEADPERTYEILKMMIYYIMNGGKN